MVVTMVVELDGSWVERTAVQLVERMAVMMV